MVRRRKRRHMPSDCREVEAAFGIVVVVVAVVGGLVAIASYIGAGRLYQEIGKGQLALDQPDRPPGPKAGSPQARAESDAELRQLLEAKSYRRVQRGEEPLDIDAEILALTPSAPTGRDAELEEEIRQHVVARNARRARKGEHPLDVEAEVRRQLEDMGG